MLVSCHFSGQFPDRSREFVSPGSLSPKWKDAAHCHFPAVPTTALGTAAPHGGTSLGKLQARVPEKNSTAFAPSSTLYVRA